MSEYKFSDSKPFTRVNDSDKKEKSIVMTIRLNLQEQEMLKEIKVALDQPKDGTAIKTMFYLAYYNVIQDAQTRYLIGTLFKNKKNNERTGAFVNE